ncbi:MAG: hypothetical protein QOK33_196, partial [Mycobacterium sp.]|nr:hypothetical protein [Mycobacterium sp.]
IRNLEAETDCTAGELTTQPAFAAAENAAGVAATTCMQQEPAASATGATCSTTGLAWFSAASGCTSAPSANNTAIGAMATASKPDDFGRALATWCRPTRALYIKSL